MAFTSAGVRCEFTLLWIASPIPTVPVANKRDTRSIEEAMNEIRAKKRLKKGEEEAASSGSNVWERCVCVHEQELLCTVEGLQDSVLLYNNVLHKLNFTCQI